MCLLRADAEHHVAGGGRIGLIMLQAWCLLGSKLFSQICNWPEHFVAALFLAPSTKKFKIKTVRPTIRDHSLNSGEITTN